jgi:hypothetical protein
MTLALADQSSMPPLAGWQMVIAVILGLAAITYLFCGPLVHRAPLQDADVSALDALDGITEGQPACHSPGPRGGHYVRAAGAWWVCEACGDTWPRADVRPYDQEASA